MESFTKYSYINKTKEGYYLFNLNNGALISLDDEMVCKIDNLKNNKFDILSKEELTTLRELGFIVNQLNDQQWAGVNKLTYAVSKYNNLNERLKIDFAITNKCNFCCPYCFERSELNRCSNNDKNNLMETSIK